MQSEEMRGRLALITGAASGIGFGIAQALAARGMKIAVADRDEAGAEQAASRLRATGAEAMAFGIDICDRAAWNTVLDKAEKAYGPLTVLGANAGVAGSVLPIAQTDPQAWDWTINVNLTGAFNSMQAGLTRMLAHGGPGHIVATASLGGFLVHAGNGAYGAAKAGVIAICEALRAELASTPIGVSVLCPGLVSTNLLQPGASHLPGVNLGEHAPELKAAMRASMDASTAGEIVAEGILQNRFWLFTHPDLGPMVEARAQEIRAAHS